MLDTIIKNVLARLSVHAAAVKAQREGIERERAGDKARAHAGRMLESPEGYATNPRTALEDAQKEFARARREWEKLGIPALTLFATYMVARERRDEMAAWLQRHEATEQARRTGDLHREVKPFFNRLVALGLLPRHVANVRPETLAIISDLIRWDGHDPDMKDPASPVGAVFGVYAERSMLQPGQVDRVERSVPGLPPIPVKLTDRRYFRFDILAPVATPSAPGSTDETLRLNAVAAEVLETADTVVGIEKDGDLPSPTQEPTASSAASTLTVAVTEDPALVAGPIEKWANLPRTFAGYKLEDTDERPFLGELVPLPRLCGIEMYADPKDDIEGQVASRETLRKYARVLARWAKTNGERGDKIVAWGWALLLSYRLKGTSEPVPELLNEEMIFVSPWDATKAVRAVKVPVD